MKYLSYLFILTIIVSRKAPSLDFGGKYHKSNYEVKRRKKIKKYLDYQQDTMKDKHKRR